MLTSCINTNISTSRPGRYFKQENSIRSDSTFKLIQKVCFNIPRLIDEEYCYVLTLKFLDISKAKSKKTLDLQTDTLIVKASYNKFSIWDWSGEITNVSGQIEILKWKKNKVVLKQNITAIDTNGNKTQKFVGKILFRK